METPWRMFLAYARNIDRLQAEEGLRQLTWIHPGKGLEKIVRTLRQRAGLLLPKKAGGMGGLATFLTNPNLRKNVVRKSDKIDSGQ